MQHDREANALNWTPHSPVCGHADEPTSGLDSYTSNEVMTVVRSLASDDVTIVATIHSPTAYAFRCAALRHAVNVAGAGALPHRCRRLGDMCAPAPVSCPLASRLLPAACMGSLVVCVACALQPV